MTLLLALTLVAVGQPPGGRNLNQSQAEITSIQDGTSSRVYGVNRLTNNRTRPMAPFGLNNPNITDDAKQALLEFKNNLGCTCSAHLRCDGRKRGIQEGWCDYVHRACALFVGYMYGYAHSPLSQYISTLRLGSVSHRAFPCPSLINLQCRLRFDLHR